MMIVNCSVEEPITSNKSLYSRVIEVDEVYLDSSDGLELNRYCLIQVTEKSDKPSLFSLSEAMVLSELLVVYTWSNQDPSLSKTESRLLSIKFKKMGAVLTEENENFVAVLPLSKFLENCSFEYFNSKAGGYFLIGENTDINILDANDLLYLALNRRFIPSTQCLNELHLKGGVLVYSVISERNRNGLVIVSSSKVDVFSIKNLEIEVAFYKDKSADVFLI